MSLLPRNYLSFAAPEGSVETTLYSTHTSVPGVLGVAGLVRVNDGSSHTSHDIVGILRGFYIIRTGELVAASSPGLFEVALTVKNTSQAAVAGNRSLLASTDGSTHAAVAQSILLQNLGGVSSATIEVLHSMAGSTAHVASPQRSLSTAGDEPEPAPSPSPGGSSPSQASLARRCSLILLGSVQRASGARRAATFPSAPAQAPPSTPTRIAGRVLATLLLGADPRPHQEAALWTHVSPDGNHAASSEYSPAMTTDPAAASARALTSSDANPPVLTLNASLSTWNCDFQGRPLQLEATAVVTDKRAVLRKATAFGILATLATVAQLVVLVPALIQGASPANGVRVSLLTLGMQASLDAHLTLAALLGSVLWDAMFGALATLAFLKLIQFSLLEMRFMVLVHKAQNPAAYSGDWGDAQRALTSLYARFYLVLLASLVLLYFFVASALPTLVFLAYSFWVPQILHSAWRGTSDGLPLRYIGVTSITRMLVPLYFYMCPSNFVVSALPDASTNLPAGIALLAWMLLQVAVLLLQRTKGARFFVPRALLPQAYNYHRRVYVHAGRVLPTAEFPDNPAEAAARALDAERAEMGEGGADATPPTRLQGMWRDVQLQWRGVSRYISEVRARVGQSNGSRGGYMRVEGGAGAGHGIIDGLPPPEVLQTANVEAEAAPVDADGTATAAPGTRAVTCAICMCEVDFPVASAEYMVTPCNHLFHKDCLAQWLNQKLECPVCRHLLPSPDPRQEAEVEAQQQAETPIADAV